MPPTLDAQSVEAALVRPPSPWQVVDVHASLDSTNLEALRAPHPWRVVVADHQSAGRGRMARQWQAPPGTSIAVSCVVPLPAGRGEDLGWLPLLSGMAMCQALGDVAGVPARLKWPNDVLVQEGTGGEVTGGEVTGGEVTGGEGTGGKRAGGEGTGGGTGGIAEGGAPWLKISGVLCEMVPGGGLVVIGAGANITQERDELPVETATSLALCGAGKVRREDVIVRYLEVLADLLATWSEGGAGMEALRAAYRSLCLTVGLEVDVHQPAGRVVRGAATGVDDAGRLVVASGRSSTAHAAGDVVHVRRSPPPPAHTA